MQELIKELREHEDIRLYLEAAMLMSEAADLIESQAAEIEKYKALCDQLRDALEEAMYSYSTQRSIDKSIAAKKSMESNEMTPELFQTIGST